MQNNKNQSEKSYRIVVIGRDISPATFPGDPERTRENVKSVFDAENRRRNEDQRELESLYVPLLEKYFSKKHSYNHFVKYYAGNFLMPPDCMQLLHLSHPDKIFKSLKLELYFKNNTALYIQTASVLQLLAMVVKETTGSYVSNNSDHFAISDEEELISVISSDTEYTQMNQSNLAKLFSNREMLEKFSAKKVESPAGYPDQNEYDIPIQTAVISGKIFSGYFEGNMNVSEILKEILVMEHVNHTSTVNYRDNTILLLLGFMTSEKLEKHKTEIKNTILEIQKLRNRWNFESYNDIDFKKVPDGVSVQINGPDTAENLMSLLDLLD